VKSSPAAAAVLDPEDLASSDPDHMLRRLFGSSDASAKALPRSVTTAHVALCDSHIQRVRGCSQHSPVVQPYAPNPEEIRFLAVFDRCAATTGITNAAELSDALSLATRRCWSETMVRTKLKKLSAKHVIVGIPRIGYRRAL
jgi:hypothetical protein